jgi:hypothetical protein
VFGVANDDMSMPSLIVNDGLGRATGEFLVRARLWWLQLAKESALPATASLVARWKAPDGGTVVAIDGPLFARCRVETVAYRVRPAQFGPTLKQGTTEYKVGSAWQVIDNGKVEGVIELALNGLNEQVPVCDPVVGLAAPERPESTGQGAVSTAAKE